MSYTYISKTPVRHTYPYGRHDLEVPFAPVAELRESLAQAFREVEECRRVVVVIDEGDLDAIRTCEDAGMSYSLDVQLPDGREVSLMVQEPDWVTSQSTDITDLELT